MIQLQLEKLSKDGWDNLYLGEDPSISMEESSQVWDTSAGTTSIPFTIPVEENLAVIGNCADMRGSSIYTQLYGRRFRLWAQGILFRSGVVHLDSTVPIHNNQLEIELCGAGKEWDDLITDLDCRDVPIKDKIVIGTGYQGTAKTIATLEVWKEGRNEDDVVISGDPNDGYIHVDDGTTGTNDDYTFDLENDFALPNCEKPTVNGVSKINISQAYPAMKYCNINICWNYKSSSSGSSTSTIDKYTNRYTTFDADRNNSSPCFYVLYFLDCLFEHIGVNCTSNSMTSVADMTRLAFVNTGCHYDNGEYLGDAKPEDLGFSISYAEGTQTVLHWLYGRVTDIKFTDDSVFHGYEAVANSDNFPSTSVSETLDALSALFGLRFLYNSLKSTLQIVFVRDILQSHGSTTIPCKMIDAYPEYEHKDGFRLRYDADVDADEVDDTDTERDTTFNYDDYSLLDTSKNYSTIKSLVTSYDKTAYYDKKTADLYRIKVNKEATNISELKPTLMEVGQYCRVEYGDCSEDDFTEVVDISVTPVVMNDVSKTTDPIYSYFADVDMNNNEAVVTTSETLNIVAHVTIHSTTGGEGSSSRGDGTAHTEETAYTSSTVYDIPVSFTFRNTWQPSYDISESTESPLDTYDPGLTLGFMRGPGSTAGTSILNPNYDGEGNAQWVTVAANSAFHADTLDNYGNQFDYTGAGDETIGEGERISLKLRAEKPNPYKGDTDSEGNSTDPYNGADFLPVTGTGAARRGIFDHFYAEYAYWVTHRKIAHIEAEVELADLVNIDFTQRYKIGDYEGFIKQLSYNLTNDGISAVTFQMYYL